MNAPALPPCQVWGRGRVTLTGDAAHLSTAMLGQGTNQAFEDALALGAMIGAAQGNGAGWAVPRRCACAGPRAGRA